MLVRVVYVSFKNFDDGTKDSNGPKVVLIRSVTRLLDRCNSYHFPFAGNLQSAYTEIKYFGEWPCQHKCSHSREFG